MMRIGEIGITILTDILGLLLSKSCNRKPIFGIDIRKCSPLLRILSAITPGCLESSIEEILYPEASNGKHVEPLD
jgi:hypothetical protein